MTLKPNCDFRRTEKYCNKCTYRQNCEQWIVRIIVMDSNGTFRMSHHEDDLSHEKLLQLQAKLNEIKAFCKAVANNA